jgi:ribonuclease HII
MKPYQFDDQFKKELRQPSFTELPGLSLSKKNNSTLIIAGVDEAGRGPLAGPVAAAVVVLPRFPRISGLADSKALTEQDRESLFDEIKSVALSYKVVCIEAEMIDRMNILSATLLAMKQAIEGLRFSPSVVLIDGNQKPGSRYLERAIVKGDAKSASIMAASILAKVTRDRIMKDWHQKFPQYGFDVPLAKILAAIMEELLASPFTMARSK